MLTGQIPALPLWRARSRREAEAMMPQLNALLIYVKKHQERLRRGDKARGYSITAERVTDFVVDWPQGGGEPNWRESLRCVDTGLINRLRGSYHAFRTLHPADADTRIYLTEAATPFYRFVKERFPVTVGSEFYTDTPFGTENAAGIRSEDLTALTFASGAFDVLMSFEVLEHVPDYRAALGECARVLGAGGTMLLTAPFIGADQTLVRASVGADGSIVHHEPPDYHGDPINAEGILCYYWFGWSLLDDLKAAGFRDAYVAFYASREFGYYGLPQSVIVATR